MKVHITITAMAILSTKSGIDGMRAIEMPRDVQSAGVPAITPTCMRKKNNNKRKSQDVSSSNLT